MTVLSRTLDVVGGLLLSHAYAHHSLPLLYTQVELTIRSSNLRCYSAIEHSSYQQSPDPSSISASNVASLPLDIILETLVSVLVICLGLVLGSPALRPISWRVWAGRVEREGSKGNGGTSTLEVNPFLGLESRVGFWDIRVSV